MSEDSSRYIEFQTDLRISDVYWLYFAGAIRRMLYGRWILAIVLVVAVALGVDRLGFLRPLLEPPLAYLLLGLLLYVTLVRPYVRSFSLVGTASYPLSATGIDIRLSQSQSHHDWSAVRLPKQTSGLIFLYFERDSALVFPKRCFATPQQLSAARAIIATHVKRKIKVSDSWP